MSATLVTRCVGTAPTGAAVPFVSQVAVFADASARTAHAEVRLAADGIWSADGSVKNSSLRLRAGEVVGVTGHDAAALAALAGACLGAPVKQGAIRIRGARYGCLGPRGVEARGAAFILADPFTSAAPAARIDLAAQLVGLARDGAAVLVLSLDLAALTSCADRILVMREGRLADEFDRFEYSTCLLPEPVRG